MMTPLGSEGGLHEMVSCTTPGVADRLDTGPGAVEDTNTENCMGHTGMEYFHLPSCSVSTVRAGELYGPVPPSLIAATCTK